jgi:hypothetical protein
MKWEPITKTPVERASANLNPFARTDPDHRVDVTSPAANPMPAAVRETHSSVVLLVGDRAVKLSASPTSDRGVRARCRAHR